ncbi:CDP-diacylglycerol--inositol 3-phosphatidyltransferase [Arthrobacter sp. Hiyo6]|nr:CDP-diacylglycerol--inositol 3-phosphatidyltransferase [Arthrobacter sp. Hiyo6]
MLNRHARGFFTALFSPLARWLLKIGVSPDAITIVGTAGVVVGALVFYPLGQLWWGTIFITAFIFSDVIDGIMARMQERGGRWGNFLDSTLDRVADGALFAGLAVWFFTGGANQAIAIAAVLCLVLGMVVSYARAKAEALASTPTWESQNVPRGWFQFWWSPDLPDLDCRAPYCWSPLSCSPQPAW